MRFRDPPVSTSTALGLQIKATMPVFYIGVLNSNSGPFAYTAGTLPAEPYPRSLTSNSLKWNNIKDQTFITSKMCVKVHLKWFFGGLILPNLNYAEFVHRTRSLQLYRKCFQIENVWFKVHSHGELGCFGECLLEEGLMHFGKRDLEGHLGFAVAQEMLGGMVCSGILGCVGHSLSQDTCFYIWTEIVLMSEKLAWGKWEGKWKNIYCFRWKTGRGEQGWAESSNQDLWAGAPFALPSICDAPLHFSFIRSSFIHLMNIYLTLPIGRSCSGSVGSSKEQSGQKYTLWRWSADDMVHSEQINTHLFEDVSIRVRWQRMANGSSSRKAFKWPFDRDTYTHFSKVCPLCGRSLWKEKSVTVIYSVEIIDKWCKAWWIELLSHIPPSALPFGFNS